MTARFQVYPARNVPPEYPDPVRRYVVVDTSDCSFVLQTDDAARAADYAYGRENADRDYRAGLTRHPDS